MFCLSQKIKNIHRNDSMLMNATILVSYPLKKCRCNSIRYS